MTNDKNIEVRVKKVFDLIAEMESAFWAIQQPRSAYVLEKFVVGQHDTPETQYSQCVLELQVKYDNIRRAVLNKKKLLIKISEYESRNTDLDQIEADLLKIDLEEQDRAMLGALREFEALYLIWQSFPQKYTREDLDKNQPEYWAKRLHRQAKQEVQATGRIGAGNNEALRQIGLDLDNSLKQLEADSKKEALPSKKCIITMITKTKKEKFDNLENVKIPPGLEIKLYNVFAKEKKEAWEDVYSVAKNDLADFIIYVDDNFAPPQDGIVKLFELYNLNESKDRIFDISEYYENIAKNSIFLIPTKII